MEMSKKFKRLISSIIVMAFVLGTMLIPNTSSNAANATLLNTYGSLFGRSGTCINLNQWKDPTTLSHVKSQYNSITLENEMKPDAMLGYSPTLITKDAAKSLGYYIPSNYTEAYDPKINFDRVDEVLTIAYENGLGVRAHTLLLHAQTPKWFFRTGFSTHHGYVSQSNMDARM